MSQQESKLASKIAALTLQLKESQSKNRELHQTNRSLEKKLQRSKIASSELKTELRAEKKNGIKKRDSMPACQPA